MNFPDWYIKEKEKAQLKLKNTKPAKYGIDIPGLPPSVNDYIKEVIELTTKKSIYPS